jgi:hypothetical protein
MTDTTIADIPTEKVVLDNTEWFEGQDGGGSFKSHVGSIRGVGAVAVTASVDDAVDVGPYPQLALVTTTGDGSGVDQINIVNPTLDGSGRNSSLIGQAIIVTLQTLTDPADYVNITVAGSANVRARNIPVPASGPYGLIRQYSSVTLNAVGDTIMFRWDGAHWYIDGSVGSFTGTPTSNVNIQPLDGAGAYLAGGDGTPGGDLNLTGGITTTGAAVGGSVVIRAGSNNDAGNGGNVTIDGGGGLANGYILVGSIVALPTADPHVANALWNNSGILTISAG